MIDKLERKIGKYAIPRLTLWLIMGYVIGYMLSFVMPRALNYLTLEPYYIIHRLQLWRLISWILIPPQSGSSPLNLLFALIMCVFYYSLGNMMERTWGTFRYNLYIFGGLICTIIGAFLLYLGCVLILGGPPRDIGYFFSTNYINMSIFLAFAACYPEQRVMLYFIFPIKIKVLAIVYVVIIALNGFSYKNMGDQYGRGWLFLLCYAVAVLSSLLNFLIFWLSIRKKDIKNAARRRKFTNSYNSGRSESRRRTGTASGWNAYTGNAQGSSGTSAGTSSSPKPNSRAKVISRHRCAVCGKSELDDPTMEFRFCSKCNGNYEYCREHLFTHTHVK